jgi:bacteriorhodopsin
MSAILARSSFESNPPIGTHHLTVAGSDWLWAVCAIYAFCMLLVVGHAYVARNGERIFHYLFTISLFTGAVAYFTMGMSSYIFQRIVESELVTSSFLRMNG